MATRSKRIKYAFPLETTGLASATRRDLAAQTIYIPEITGRTFKAVFVDVWARQTDVAATSLTSWLIGVKLGAVAFSDVSTVSTIGNTGEHTEWHFRRECSSYFNTNFGAGGSQTMQVGVQFGAVGTINIFVEVTIVYEFDDSAATTRVKTVQIPLDSGTGLLTNALAEIGTDQIPQLTGGGILPEASIVVRDWYLKIQGNERVQGGTTDFALGMQIDADPEVTEGLRESALATSCAFATVYSRKASVPTTTTTHKFKARCAAVTSRFQFSIVLVVTYEYDHANSTQILNSLEIPISPANNDVITQAATTSADRHTFDKDLWLQEPGTLTLKQSGVLVQVESNSGTTDVPFVVVVGAGAARTYTIVKAAEVSAGNHAQIGHRIDAGGAGGSAITLARGKNTFSCEFYWTAAFGSSDIPEGCHMVLLLNYVSDKHTDGDGAHNHTIEFNIQDTKASAVSFDNALACSIPEPAFYLNAFGIRSHLMFGAGEGAYLAWGAKFDAAEGPGIGWQSLRGNFHGHNNNLGWVQLPIDCSHLAKRWIGDPDTRRMDIEVSRTYRFTSVGAANIIHASLLATYHSIKWSQPFTVRNYPSGDGSGILVSLHRDDTRECVLRGTTTAGGVVTFTWYDDTKPVFACSPFGTQPNAYRGMSAVKAMSA